MKKQLIAGAASAVLAAMPVVGAFATDYTFVDYVKVTVKASCTMTADPADGYSQEDAISFGPMSVGKESDEKAGSVMKVACNSATPWKIEATATNMTDDTKSIAFGAYPSAGDIKKDGTPSTWSIKLAKTGENVEITDGWDTLEGTKSTNKTTVVESTTGNANGATITPTYKVFVGGDQDSGSYTGSVTYSFTAES